MLSRWIRTWDGAYLRPFLTFLARLGVTANMLTLASLLVAIIAGTFFASRKMVLGAGILLLAGFLDGVDDELARTRGISAPFGAFLDSICDHCGDFVISLGLLLPFLQGGAFTEVVLILIGLFASVFESHVRSRAGMLGIDTKTIGLFTRCERIFVLVIGILVGKITIDLWVLAIFSSFSAVKRVFYTIRAWQNNGVSTYGPNLYESK